MATQSSWNDGFASSWWRHAFTCLAARWPGSLQGNEHIQTWMQHSKTLSRDQIFRAADRRRFGLFISGTSSASCEIMRMRELRAPIMTLRSKRLTLRSKPLGVRACRTCRNLRKQARSRIERKLQFFDVCANYQWSSTEDKITEPGSVLCSHLLLHWMLSIPFSPLLSYHHDFSSFWTSKRHAAASSSTVDVLSASGIHA